MRTLIVMLPLAVGVMIAITGAAKMPAEGRTFPDTWPIFLLGVAIAVGGLIVWHVDVRRQAHAAKADAAERQHDPVVLLVGLREPLADLGAGYEQLTSEEITDRIDALFEEHILPMEQVRHGMIDRFGMSTGAEILVAVATGERQLNRAWSAAADGDPREARRCIPQAIAAFELAERLVDEAEAEEEAAGA